MRGGESKKREQEQMGKSVRAGNTDCRSDSEGKCKQESKHMRARRRRRPCLKRSVMSAINNRCKKLSCLQ